MTKRNRPIYHPTLRMKMGELEGLRALNGDVADCVIPVLVIPPLSERDSHGQEVLFSQGEAIPDVGGVVSRYWPLRPVFLDVRALLKELGFDKCQDWLPSLFSRSRNCDVIAIPSFSLSELEKIDALVVKHCISSHDLIKLGLRISSGEMTDPDLRGRVANTLANIGITPQDCAVFSDFSDADLSDYEVVSPIIRGALEQLQEFGEWQEICFQATHYPEKNPAMPGETFVQPRNEWLAWRHAVKFDPSTAEHMVFGDFCADSSKFDFEGQRARPIPHCRYTVGADWLVVRGRDEGSTHEVMRDVFQRILNSGNFSGRRFSEADAYIEDAANGASDGSGNASTWRQINTTHHITRVVADIAKVRGIQISEFPSAPSGVQLELLGD